PRLGEGDVHPITSFLSAPFFLQHGFNPACFWIGVDHPRELEISSRCSLRLTALQRNAILQHCFIWHSPNHCKAVNFCALYNSGMGLL
ncbi:MAG: hypothetical protein OWQ56_11555, partial [Acidithiobacillus caldus]|nr:hypothetical protein [Acidithiobacillus caldus]